MKTPIKGAIYEDAALRYLQHHALKIITRNFHCYFGEIDLVALDQQTLVFIEVRYRQNKAFGSSSESIHYFKQQKIKKTAEYFLIKHPIYQKNSVRFDVLALDKINIEWIKGAFY